MKIYLDSCCYNRPFDDQTQEKIRFEAIAIEYIFKNIEIGIFELISSDVLELELKKNPDELKRSYTLQLLDKTNEKVLLDNEMLINARKFEKMGFKAFDALHIAISEFANSEFLLTTDSKMILLANKIKNVIKIKILNPIDFIKEYL